MLSVSEGMEVCPVFLKSGIQTLHHHYKIVPIRKMMRLNGVQGRLGGFAKFNYQNLLNMPENVQALSILVSNLKVSDKYS